jgi:REP element-mobilizing transposase RayT
MYAPLEGYNLQVPKLQHYYGLNHLHYLTNSTYRRTRLYDSERFRNHWVVTLGDLRRELGFKIVGYVLMPEHFHALIWPTAQANPSQVMQKVAQTCFLGLRLFPAYGNNPQTKSRGPESRVRLSVNSVSSVVNRSPGKEKIHHRGHRGSQRKHLRE